MKPAPHVRSEECVPIWTTQARPLPPWRKRNVKVTFLGGRTGAGCLLGRHDGAQMRPGQICRHQYQYGEPSALPEPEAIAVSLLPVWVAAAQTKFGWTGYSGTVTATTVENIPDRFYVDAASRKSSGQVRRRTGCNRLSGCLEPGLGISG